MGLLNCGDTRNYLKDYGYGTIALPRASIKPLLMLTRNNGRLTPLGPVTSTFSPGAVPLPTASRGEAAPVSGSRSGGVDAKIGINILGTVIGALAGSALGIKAAYKDARKVEFEFGQVMEDQVTIADLDQFLATATVAGNVGPFLKELLDDDEVYIVVATLDAKEISVAATRDNNASLELEVPVIQQLAGGNIAVSGTGATSSTIVFKSKDTSLAFGVKVVRLDFEDGRYTTMKIVKAKEAHVAAAVHNADDDSGDPAVIVPDVPVEL
jgi:hypothetical protein